MPEKFNSKDRQKQKLLKLLWIARERNFNSFKLFKRNRSAKSHNRRRSNVNSRKGNNKERNKSLQRKKKQNYSVKRQSGRKRS